MVWQRSEIWLFLLYCFLDHSGIDGRTLIVLLTINKKRFFSIKGINKVFLRPFNLDARRRNTFDAKDPFFS